MSRRDRNNCLFISLGGMYFALFGPDGWVFNACAITVSSVATVLMVRASLKDAKAQDRLSEIEKRQKRIRELEADLGFEPLNLHELHPILDEQPEPRKEN